MSIYVSMLCSIADVENVFYDEFEVELYAIPATEHLFLLGDFNARVSSDHDS